MKTTQSQIELLEARIAPALLIGAGGKSATFTDADGDLVRVSLSKGTLTATDFTFLDAAQTRLASLNFSGDADKAHADLSLIATPQKDAMGVLHGDGFVNLGELDAFNLDLGRVLVDGDLAQMSIGDSDPARPAARSITVQSIGAFGKTTGASNVFLQIHDGLGSLAVKGDVNDAVVEFSGNVGGVSIGGSLLGGQEGSLFFGGGGKVGSILVKGSVIGGPDFQSGQINVNGPIGSLTVGGSIIGGAGYLSGHISLADAGVISIGGDVIGGGGFPGSGDLVAKKVGSLKIGGSIHGSAAEFGGYIGLDSARSVTIGGSIFGGEGKFSGRLQADDIGQITIGGDIVGGDGNGAGTAAGKTWKSVRVGGSIVGGEGAQSGQLFLDKSLALTVGGSVLGGDGAQSGRLLSTIAGNVTIGGDIAAGEGNSSGRVAFPAAVSVKVAGDLRGGDTANSGRLAVANAASVWLGGSVIGGSGMFSGELDLSTGTIGMARVGHDVIGGDGDGSGHVKVDGTIRTLTIGGSVIGGDGADSGEVFGSLGGKMKTLKIGRHLMGGDGVNSGSLQLEAGTFDLITVGGSLVGGDGQHSGSIGNASGLNWKGKAFAIGGSVFGGAGDDSGQISTIGFTVADPAISFIKIKGDLSGGVGNSSGAISTNNHAVLSFTLGGSLLGGSGDDSGSLQTGDLGNASIGGSIVGATLENTVGHNVRNSGAFDVNGHLGSLKIGGSFIAGTNSSTMYEFEGGSTISATGGIGLLAIKGSVVGHGPGDRARILAEPDANHVAIAQLTVGGGVRFAQVLAGYHAVNGVLNAFEGDSQIGSVVVGGDWESSSLVAGVAPGADGNFGFNFKDAQIAGGDPAVVARIASIVIKGQAFGSANVPTDSYGIVAERFGRVKIGGVSVPVPAANSFHLLGPTDDFTLGVVTA